MILMVIQCVEDKLGTTRYGTRRLNEFRMKWMLILRRRTAPMLTNMLTNQTNHLTKIKPPPLPTLPPTSPTSRLTSLSLRSPHRLSNHKMLLQMQLCRYQCIDILLDGAKPPISHMNSQKSSWTRLSRATTLKSYNKNNEKVKAWIHNSSYLHRTTGNKLPNYLKKSRSTGPSRC